MIKKKYPYQLTEEEFNNIIDACGKSLLENKKLLYDLYMSSKTRDMDINFRFRPDEVVSMNIFSEKAIFPEGNNLLIYY